MYYLYVRARKMCGVYSWCIGKATWSVGDAFLWVGVLWCCGLSLRGWKRSAMIAQIIRLPFHSCEAVALWVFAPFQSGKVTFPAVEQGVSSGGVCAFQYGNDCFPGLGGFWKRVGLYLVSLCELYLSGRVA